MYRVINWDTDKVMGTFEKLSKAKRACRAEGHTGELSFNNRFLPVAYVADADGYVVYNPRFRAKV